MTLSCKEVTATMAQELEQPIYVKPNRGDAYEQKYGLEVTDRKLKVLLSGYFPILQAVIPDE